MSRKTFDPKESIVLLNNIKTGFQFRNTPISAKTLREGLKSCGFPTNGTFWSVFCNSGIIQKVSKGHYLFTSKNPIYVGFLEEIQREYRKRVHKYNKNATDKKKQPQKPVESHNEIAMAIELLKKNGYLVYAPC